MALMQYMGASVLQRMFDMTGEGSPEARRPQYGEMQHTLERTAFLDGLLNSAAELGDEMGIDLRSILPGHHQFRYYANHTAMNAGLVAAGSRPVPEDNNAVCVGGEVGIFVTEGTGPNDTNSTSAHELAHQLSGFLWGVRTTALEKEMNAEMFGAALIHKMGPNARGGFQPSYGGLGIIGDELIRHIAAQRGITARQAYLDYAKDMFSRFGDGRQMLEGLLGRELTEWFVSLNHSNRDASYWAAVARHLGLPDAVRRLSIGSLLGVNIMRWLRRDQLASIPPPLGTQPGDERIPYTPIMGAPNRPGAAGGPQARQAVKDERPAPPSTPSTGGGGPNTYPAAGTGGGGGARTGGGVSVAEIKAAIDLAKQQMQEALGAVAVAREKLEEGKQLLGAAFDGSGSDLVGSAYASLAEADEKAEEAQASVAIADENATTFHAVL